MTLDFGKAFVAGVERVTAWSDLLDRINVFPVADGDTGRNLVISLSPLRRFDLDRDKMTHHLLLSARGNSGNIAARFFQSFIKADSLEMMAEAVGRGRDRAWQAVHDPRPGTMLTFFDALVDILQQHGIETSGEWVKKIMDHLEAVVRATRDLQPKLKRAGVVDAGALGMFIYFDGFLNTLVGNTQAFRSVTAVFKGGLQVSSGYQDDPETGYCVDTLLRSEQVADEALQTLTALGESVVVTRNEEYLKVHFHTLNRDEARQQLVRLGQVVGWAEDNLSVQMEAFRREGRQPAIHVMTDAAGSVTREEAQELGMTLLDSYITIGDRCLPETYFGAGDVYDAMRQGIRVSTSQASVFERHQIYESVLSRNTRVLYLCVGSVYTGNYAVAMEWKRNHDPEDRFVVIDTTAASGRLGTLALAVARCSLEASDPDAVIAFARKSVARCEEYIFLDKLEYLAAGGRLSKTSAFFGDMLHMKPIVSPTAEGAKKIGVVRNQTEQLRFALERLCRALRPDDKAMIMLQYSDNRSWVEDVKSEIEKQLPAARITLHALSLTSGAHMGPGTWAVAFLPEISKS